MIYLLIKEQRSLVRRCFLWLYIEGDRLYHTNNDDYIVTKHVLGTPLLAKRKVMVYLHYIFVVDSVAWVYGCRIRTKPEFDHERLQFA